jgi:hypothetical protein
MKHDFLLNLPFRAIFSSLILIPTALILAIYAYFHILLWNKRDISKSTVSKQNIRAAKTTFLIMFTCTAGWLPATVNHLLICENGCQYRNEDFSFNTIFVLHAISYVLIILKSFTNPLIFAVRQKNIREAVKRLIFFLRHCKDLPRLQRSASKYTSIISKQNSVRQVPNRIQTLRQLGRGSTKSSLISFNSRLHGKSHLVKSVK